MVVSCLMTYQPKKCEVCGKTFTPVNSFHKFCSEECSKEHRREYMKQYNEEHQDELLKYRKDYYSRNSEKIKERKREYGKRYWENNKEHLKKYYKGYREKRKHEAMDKIFEAYAESLTPPDTNEKLKYKL